MLKVGLLPCSGACNNGMISTEKNKDYNAETRLESIEQKLEELVDSF